jgi:hypothetical protein
MFRFLQIDPNCETLFQDARSIILHRDHRSHESPEQGKKQPGHLVAATPYWLDRLHLQKFTTPKQTEEKPALAGMLAIAAQSVDVPGLQDVQGSKG